MKIWGGALLVVALTFAMSGVASADVTIGSTTQPTGSTPAVTNPPPQETFVQQSSAAFPVTVPAGGGRISSWSTATTGSMSGSVVQLVVLRPTGSGSFTVIAVDSRTLPTPLPASGVATFNLAVPIPVQGGDLIGLNVQSGSVLLGWTSGPSTDTTKGVESSPPAPPATGQTVEPTGPPMLDTQVNLSAFVSQSTDVGVTTSAGPARPSVGNLAVLQSSVTSSEPGVPVTFTDSVPAGLTINSAVAGGGSCSVSGQTVSCTIPSVNPGSSTPVDVLVTPRATGNYTNNVSVAPPTGFTDPNRANNTASATLSVRNFATNACTVPNLRRTSAPVAKRVLKQLGCKVKIKRKNGRGVPKGTVLKTKPKPGTYKLGRKITVIVRK